jgi:hypothetical protein
MTLSINDNKLNAECRILFIVILIVVMLNVTYAECRYTECRGAVSHLSGFACLV